LTAARAHDELDAIRRRTIACRRCPELRAYCARIAKDKKREFAGDTYWGRPLPSLGDATARLLIVGLAPAAHGGNRTGRMFTGDGSAAWLARALYRNGFANAPNSDRVGDGYAPIDAFITAALRCAPPGNKPTREQLARCASHMDDEISILRRLRVAVGLGKIGFDAAVDRLAQAGYGMPDRRPRFGHAVEYALDPPPGRRSLVLLGSFHPSRQNTNTGKLTQSMLDSVFARARRLLDGANETR
jgi:uracil-DNA glycosylase